MATPTGIADPGRKTLSNLPVSLDTRDFLRRPWGDMSYSLNSLKGVMLAIVWWTTIGAIIGDTRSLDYSSYVGMYGVIFLVGPSWGWSLELEDLEGAF